MTQDIYLRKALLDTQERIRDYMNYSDQIQDEDLKKCFRDFATTEGKHAQILQSFIGDIEPNNLYKVE